MISINIGIKAKSRLDTFVASASPVDRPATMINFFIWYLPLISFKQAYIIRRYSNKRRLSVVPK